jgi:hypothetical protein
VASSGLIKRRDATQRQIGYGPVGECPRLISNHRSVMGKTCRQRRRNVRGKQPCCTRRRPRARQGVGPRAVSSARSGLSKRRDATQRQIGFRSAGECPRLISNHRSAMGKTCRQRRRNVRGKQPCCTRRRPRARQGWVCGRGAAQARALSSVATRRNAKSAIDPWANAHG